MYKTLIESIKNEGFRKRKLNRIFESIRSERGNLRLAINESEEEGLNEEDVVTAVTNIVKSLADLKVNEAEEIANDLEEKLEDLEETEDEEEKVEIVKETEEIVSDIIAEYDIDDFADDSIDFEENVEIDLDEEDLDEPTDPYDVATLDESEEPEDLENIDVDVEYVEKEYIDENEELDKIEEELAKSLEEVEELTGELAEEESDKEKDEIVEELEDAIEETEEILDEYEDKIDEDDQPAIEYVNEARYTLARAKTFLESEKEFEESFEIEIDEEDDLDEETRADVEDIVESLIGDEPDLKEQAEDALDTIQELKEELDNLEESDSEDAPYTKEELDQMEETLNKFLDESEEVDEDEIDDIIKNIGEAEDQDAIEEADEENKIVEEGINSLCKRLGMKSNDRREFSTLFEMAVLNASKLIHKRMAKRQDMKLKRLAEGFAQMAVATGKRVLTENKRQIKDKIALQESAKANRLISEALRSNGYSVTNESTTRRVKRYEKIAESKQAEINKVKKLLKAQHNLLESQERKLLVSKIAKDRNLTLSEEIKLEKMCRSLKGLDITEAKVSQVAKMFFNESKSQKPRLGKTSYIKENQQKREQKPVKKDKDGHEVLVESVLSYLDNQ